MPDSLYSLSLSVNASHTMRKNQPPAILIIEFQTSPIIDDGSSIHLKRSHQLKRNTAAASRCSIGIELSEWKKLKVMFQACPVKIITTATSSKPMLLPLNSPSSVSNTT